MPHLPCGQVSTKAKHSGLLLKAPETQDLLRVSPSPQIMATTHTLAIRIRRFLGVGVKGTFPVLLVLVTYITGPYLCYLLSCWFVCLLKTEGPSVLLFKASATSRRALSPETVAI